MKPPGIRQSGHLQLKSAWIDERVIVQDVLEKNESAVYKRIGDRAQLVVAVHVAVLDTSFPTRAAKFDFFSLVWSISTLGKYQGSATVCARLFAAVQKHFIIYFATSKNNKQVRIKTPGPRMILCFASVSLV